MNWEEIRKDFPVATNVTYFQSAGMSPVPNPVLEKIKDAFTQLNQSGDVYFLKDLVSTEQLKGTLAKMINTEAQNIAIMPNNSIAMSVVAMSFKQTINKSFNVISMEDEFPSTTVPYEYQGITMKYVKPEKARFPIDKILEEIDENTLAVVTSYVQYCTGFRQDLEKLGKELKERNILFVVNATQGFPLFPVDVTKSHIDVLTCSIHKWGFAGHIGTVFYTSPEFRKRFKAPMAGWLSVALKDGEFIHTKKNVPFKLHESAQRYHTGTYNLHNLLGLKASIEYLSNIGFDNIRERLFELGDYLISKLMENNIPIVSPIEKQIERSAIISISLGDNNPELLKYLDSKQIFASLRQGMIRIAFNIFNNFDDIDTIVSAIVDFKKNN